MPLDPQNGGDEPSGAAQGRFDSQSPNGRPDISELIDRARYWHRMHQHALRLRKGNDLATGATLRTLMGWRLNLPEAERKEIEKRAAVAMEQCEAYLAALDKAKAKGKALPDAPTGDAQEFAFLIEANYRATKPFDDLESRCKRELEKIGRELPCAEWWCSQAGLSGKQLAEIIAETGDLANYPNHRHVWKRLGLAPYNGMAYSNWRKKGGLTKEEWIEAKYSPKRRSITFNIGESLIKAKNIRHRALYDARRAHTAVTHPDWTKGHSSDDAKRVMVKRLISGLWSEWRRPNVTLQAIRSVAAANQSSALAEGEPVQGKRERQTRVGRLPPSEGRPAA